jgi:hypothetical protein
MKKLPIAIACLVATTPLGSAALRAAEPSDPRVASALATARTAATELSGQIKALLMKELGAGGFEGAVRVCASTAPQKTAEYVRESGHDVRRVSLRNRNPHNAPDAYERAVLESFDRLGVEERPGSEHWEVVREDGRESLRYLKPLVANAMCLTCHGDASRIPPAVKAVLDEEYPGDRATGFSEGDVRGAVSVRVPLVPAR